MSIVIKFTKKYGRLVMPGLPLHPAAFNTVTHGNQKPLDSASIGENAADARNALKKFILSADADGAFRRSAE